MHFYWQFRAVFTDHSLVCTGIVWGGWEAPGRGCPVGQQAGSGRFREGGVGGFGDGEGKHRGKPPLVPQESPVKYLWARLLPPESPLADPLWGRELEKNPGGRQKHEEWV